ncbi:MAG: hypothetical protein H6925_04920 [Holosporaceae bacterium]|nr:MAG: hypothetical protein H6925_04920 [Holosporaceae bacterium]
MFFSALFLSLSVVCAAFSFKKNSPAITEIDALAPPPAAHIVYLSTVERTLLARYQADTSLPTNFADLTPPLQIALMQHFAHTPQLQRAKQSVPDLSTEGLSAVPATLLTGYVPEAQRFMVETGNLFRADLYCSMQTTEVSPDRLSHAQTVLATVGCTQVQGLLTKINAQARAIGADPLYESPLESAACIVEGWFQPTNDIIIDPNIAADFPTMAGPLTRAHQTLYRLFFIPKALVVRAHLHPHP